MPLNRKNVTISLPTANDDASPYDLTDSGAFREGELEIDRRGLRISGVGTPTAPAPTPTGAKRAGVATPTGAKRAVRELSPAEEDGEKRGGKSRELGDRARSTSSRDEEEGADEEESGGECDGDGAADARPGSADGATTSEGSGGHGGASFDMALEDLQVIDVVGRGGSGVVQRVTHRPTGRILARKIVQMNVQAEVRKNIISELRALHSCDCPHVVPYHAAFFSEGSISIVLDYMDGGSLSDVTRAVGAIPEAQLAGFARQIVAGLGYLHATARIIHRDVKPSNLLVDRRGRVKISDFGVSGQLANSVTKCNSWVGTVTYMSPERISGLGYGFDSDVWSLGLSLLECALGRFPYPPCEPGEWTVGPREKGADGCALGFWDLLDHIVEETPPRLGEGDAFSADFAAFIATCLVKEPGKRAAAGELLKSAWIEGVDEGADDVALAELVTRAADLRAEEKKPKASEEKA